MNRPDWASVGPALSDAFLRTAFEPTIRRLGAPVPAPATVHDAWTAVRTMRQGGAGSRGPRHVAQRMLTPLAAALGYGRSTQQGRVSTRVGAEDGGLLLTAADGTCLRAWAVGEDTPIDAAAGGGKGNRRGTRFSPARAAHRVLRATREVAGLLTDGSELRLLLSDPALPDSHLAFALGGPGGWTDRTTAPEGLRLLLALASPRALPHLPAILAAARLHQTGITSALRAQARAALEGFLQAVLDHPTRADTPAPDPVDAAALWHDGLVMVYRLLFILKLESATDPARAFSFAATRLWRESLSPNRALGPLVRRHLDHGHDTGALLEDGLRLLFRCCGEGLESGEISIAPLGGALFGADAMPLLDRLRWGDPAVARLLDRLLWTSPKGRPRERVHYGLLDVEELGGIYESLLDLEPAIEAPRAGDSGGPRFVLRTGALRKATGAYYTPHGFVRHLVRATLGPKLASLSPPDGPDPQAILGLRVVDPACGSGHFLVEACRYLGDALYEACRRCDADPARFRDRIAALPDPDGLLAAYLPSRAPGRLAEARAVALCRRLVAVHCLYGVDRNRLAVELAKLSLWLESHAEGLPLTFLDHRLLCGDSLAGPFVADMTRLPVGGGELDPLLAHGIAERLIAMHRDATTQLAALRATLGRDLADLALKQAAKARLDAAQAALLSLARAWSGAAMLAPREGDDEYLALALHVAETGAWPAAPTPRQRSLTAAGAEALPWDLVFPDVFARGGFDVVLGNPPWDVVQHNSRDYAARHDPAVRAAPDRRAQAERTRQALADPTLAAGFATYRQGFDQRKRLAARLFRHQRVGEGRGATAGNLDLFRLFAERAMQIAAPAGALGLLLPAAFHANEGTTGIRRLYLANGLDTCLSFENRAGIFEIDSRFRFDLVVAHRPGPAPALRCAFYLDGIGRVDEPGRLMRYDHAFVAATDPVHQTLLELRGPDDQRIAQRLFEQPHRFGSWCARAGIRLGRDLHMTDDAHRFTPADDRTGGPGWLVLHEGKTFHQFTDRWDTAPALMVGADSLAGKPLVAAAAPHARLAFRDIARSTDQRCAIAALLPPGVVAGHTVTIEKAPTARVLSDALVLLALFNSFPFDWLVRLKAATHLSLYLLDRLPLPDFDAQTATALADVALVLSANHAGYAPVMDAHFGPSPHGRPGWPRIAEPDIRWRLRAGIDALVAHAYGLGRADYARILGSFNHKAWPDAPALCLEAHDALAAGRLTAATLRRTLPGHRPPAGECTAPRHQSRALPVYARAETALLPPACPTAPTASSPPNTRPTRIRTAIRATRQSG